LPPQEFFEEGNANGHGRQRTAAWDYLRFATCEDGRCPATAARDSAAAGRMNELAWEVDGGPAAASPAAG